MPIDASIPLGIQTPNPMQTISSLLNVRGQQQQLQAGQMANQATQINLQEKQGLQQVMSDPSNYTGDDGKVDFNKLTKNVMAVAPTTGSAAISNFIQVHQQATQAQASVNELDSQVRTQVGQIATSLHGKPPEVVASVLGGLAKQYPQLAPGVNFFMKNVGQAALDSGDQGKIDDALTRFGQLVQPTNTQQAMRTPGGPMVGNGQTTQQVSTTPGTDVPTGHPVPGTVQQQQLPPTTPVVNADGSQGYLGSQGQGGPAVFDLSGDRVKDLGLLNGVANNPRVEPEIRAQARAQLQQMQSAKPQASLPPGQTANMVNNVEEMNRHYAGLQDQAAGAQLVTGLTGNIKALADQAATGTGGGRKAFLDGLLSALHIPGTGDLQKDTDLLEKNMAQLNLGTPAGSDAARTLVAAARPHSSMNAGAIKDAADQVASQVQANMAIRNMLAPAKQMGDVQTYNAQRQKLEQVADPRAWQYMNLGPGSQAAKDFIAKLTPADRKALGEKIQQLESMGMLK